MAAGDVPAEYGISDRGVALESARNVERSGGERIFRRISESDGDASLLLWLWVAAARLHAKRRHRERWLFAADGWRSRIFLEKQPLSHAAIHGREGRVAS